MKIGILTHYNVASHGAYLQLYAMYKTLEKMGHTPYVLTYNKNFDFMNEEESKRFQIGLKSIPYYFKRFFLEGGPSNFLFQIKKHQELSRFGKTTFRYRKYAEPGLDYALIGADEVLSLQCGVNYMMYGHGIGASRVVAYAPSFGQTDLAAIDCHNVRGLISNGLSSMYRLSARDESTAEIMELLTGRSVPIVCDPALLYDFEKEKRDIKKAPMEKPYVLVYAYSSNMNDSSTVDDITAFAKKNGYRLISLEGYHSWCDKNIACNPIDMLAWFANAKAVVTDTFHGTISSVITHAPLAVFTRSTNTVKMQYLIKQLGLANRVIDGRRTIDDVIAIDLDYDAIDSRIKIIRNAGYSYLNNALTDIL